MDDLDRALLEAWNRAKRPDEKADEIAEKSTYKRPLRSFALVLRADDKRLFDHCNVHDHGWIEWDVGGDSPECAVDGIELTRDSVEALCMPIEIPYPGVTIDQAARMFGVNRTTIHHWSKTPLQEAFSHKTEPVLTQSEVDETSSEGWKLHIGERFERREGIIVMDLYMKREGTNRHRADKRVWTRKPVFPSGEIFSMDCEWGALIREPSIPLDDSWSQIIDRTHRPLGEKSLMCMFRCSKEVGGCGRWTRKLFLPRKVWTLRDYHSKSNGERRRQLMNSAKFVCHRCAGLVYESSERKSKPASNRRVNTWDRFIKRASGGALNGSDITNPQKIPPSQLCQD